RGLKERRQRLDWRKEQADQGRDVTEGLLMMSPEIEMPEMDGYTLTAEARSDPRLKDLHVMLHPSLSGVFNQAMVSKVGADDFLAKFSPDELADRVLARMRGAGVEHA